MLTIAIAMIIGLVIGLYFDVLHDEEKVFGFLFMVISGIIDDSTGNIRIVLFREQAEKLLGMKTSEAKRIFDSEKNIAAILKNIEIGKEFIFEGRVQRNSIFDRLEFLANNIKDINITNEIKLLLEDELCRN